MRFLKRFATSATSSFAVSQLNVGITFISINMSEIVLYLLCVNYYYIYLYKIYQYILTTKPKVSININLFNHTTDHYESVSTALCKI